MSNSYPSTRAKVLGVVFASASTVMASADSRRSDALTPLPIAYTQYYCVIPPFSAWCSLDSYVATPYGQTVGPHDFAPSWSPDATQIAFTRDDDIAVMDAAATTFVNITNTASMDWYPVWSPDGRRIAFASNRDGSSALYVMDPDGINVVQVTLTAGLTRATWSPDGTRLAYACEVDAGNSDICAINVNGTGFLRVTNDPAQDAGPAWSPDGATIAFATTRFGPEMRLAVMSPDGSGVTQLGGGIAGWEPAWSPNGVDMAFTAPAPYGDFAVGIYTMHADGSNITLIAVDAAGPAWAPAPLHLSASFTAWCNGTTCTLDASRSVGAVTYAWEFGDQTAGTGAVVNHTYPGGGTFTITLTVTDSNDGTATSQAVVDVNKAPVASFTFSCDEALTCVFDGSASFDPDGSIGNWFWRFGDGTAYDGPTVVVHTYASAATYTTTLQVTDSSNASMTTSQTFTLATPRMHVGDLDGTSSGTGTWTATVTIEVHGANHTPIPGAVVAASWSLGGTASCTTKQPGTLHGVAIGGSSQ